MKKIENDDISITKKIEEIPVPERFPNKKSYKSNISIPSEENIDRIKNWSEDNKL